MRQVRARCGDHAARRPMQNSSSIEACLWQCYALHK